MSKRKQHNKRVSSILTTLEHSLQLTLKETQAQEEIDRAIIEQLIQTDIISKIKSTETLKLIIYELILLCYQQNAKKIETNNENGPLHSRIKNLLWAIKQVLAECYSQNEQVSLKLIETKTQRLGFTGERSTKNNKFRIFSSYLNQFSTLVDELQSRSKQKIQLIEQSKEQALIGQLESLVFKKDQQLKLAKQDFLAQINQNKALEQKISMLNDDIKCLKKQNMELTHQNFTLAQNLKLIMIKNDEENDQNEENNQRREQTQWQQGFKIRKEVVPRWQQNQLLQIVMSQAMTIQALIT